MVYDLAVRWRLWEGRKQRRGPQNLGVSISDPAAYRLLTGFDPDGLVVSEETALQQSPLYRAVALISQTLGSLPMISWTGLPGGDRRRVPSVFDDPDGVLEGQTPFEWKETLFVHALLHGRAGALKLRNASGTLVGLQLKHPYLWKARPASEADHKAGRLPRGGLWFDLTLDDGTRRRYDSNDFWYVPSTSLDGRQGVGLLQLARESLKTTISGEKASQKLFAHGALAGGFATPADAEEDVTDDRAQIQRELDNALHGPDNAGRIGLISARLNIEKWALSAVDAQLLQSRQFQIEEISRWTGVPPHALMQTEKQTSWGTGVDEQNRGLGRTVLSPWSVRVEERATRELARPRWVEFDFTSIERSSPDKERDMIRNDWNAGLIMLNEARIRMNLEKVPDGDRFKTEPSTPASDPPNGGNPNDDPAADPAKEGVDA